MWVYGSSPGSSRLSGWTLPSGQSWITIRWKNCVGKPWKWIVREIGKPNVGDLTAMIEIVHEVRLVDGEAGLGEVERHALDGRPDARSEPSSRAGAPVPAALLVGSRTRSTTSTNAAMVCIKRRPCILMLRDLSLLRVANAGGRAGQLLFLIWIVDVRTVVLAARPRPALDLPGAVLHVVRDLDVEVAPATPVGSRRILIVFGVVWPLERTTHRRVSFVVFRSIDILSPSWKRFAVGIEDVDLDRDVGRGTAVRSRRWTAPTTMTIDELLADEVLGCGLLAVCGRRWLRARRAGTRRRRRRRGRAAGRPWRSEPDVDRVTFRIGVHVVVRDRNGRNPSRAPPEIK